MSKKPKFATCVGSLRKGDSETYRDFYSGETRRRFFRSICGREVGPGFVFEGVDQALDHVRKDGRLLICANCSKKVVEIIQKGSWPFGGDEGA